MERMQIRSDRFKSALLPVILLLSAGVRLWHLNWRDFWYDEAFTGVVIRAPLGEMMHMIGRDIHPPLYYILAKFFSFLFDYSVAGIRLYSVFFGILGVWVVYLLARELLSVRAGLFAAAITAVAPFAIQYSQEARMYTQYAFLIVLAAYFLVRACKTERLKYSIAWGGTLGLAALTHYVSFLFIPAFIIIILLMRNTHPDTMPPARAGRMIFPIRNVLVGLFVACIVFLPWLPQATDQFHRTQSSGLGWVPQVRPVDVMYTIQTFFFGAPPGNLSQGVGTPTNQLHGLPAIYVAGIVTFLTVGVALWLLFRTRRSGGIVALLSIGSVIVLYVFSLTGHKYYVVRYLLPAAYFFYMLLGAWLARIRFRWAVLFLAVYGIGIAAIVHPAIPHGWNELKADRAAYDQNVFYVLGPIDYVIAKYYVPEDRLILYNADQPDYRPTDWAAIGDRLQSMANPADLVGGRSLVLSYLRLDLADHRPPALKNQQFQLVRSYDLLMIFR